MTFRDIIEQMHQRDPGVTSGAVVGTDGLTVEEWLAPGETKDLSALGAEVVQHFRESARIAAENGLGTAEEVYFGGGNAMVFARKVTEEYFLVIVAASGAVPGKCRFLLRQAARRVREML
jgi:predicted regulator of Ras-like GTPase activity (Roadblock/LC7/MglB family)